MIRDDLVWFQDRAEGTKAVELRHNFDEIMILDLHELILSTVIVHRQMLVGRCYIWVCTNAYSLSA